jgi:hypothetical protein
MYRHVHFFAYSLPRPRVPASFAAAKQEAL